MNEIKEVEIEVHCTACGMFRTMYVLNVNEHGFFTVPEAHCPYCLLILEQTIKDI